MCFVQAQIVVCQVVAQGVVSGGGVGLQLHDPAHVFFQLGKFFQLPIDVAACVEQFGIVRVGFERLVQNAHGLAVAFLFFKNVRVQQRYSGFFFGRFGWQMGQLLQGLVELAVLHQPLQALQLRLFVERRRGDALKPLLRFLWLVKGVCNARQHEVSLQIPRRGLLRCVCAAEFARRRFCRGGWCEQLRFA